MVGEGWAGCVIRADGDEWVDGGRDLHGEFRQAFRVRRGADLERLLYLYFGNLVREPKFHRRHYFGPSPAPGWRVDADGVFDRRGRLRFTGRFHGPWTRDELTRLLTFPAPVVARAAISRRGWPLGELTWGQKLSVAAGMLLLVGVAPVVGNTALTVILFAVTLPIAGYLVLTLFLHLLFSDDATNLVTRRFSGVVALVIVFGALAIVVAAIWWAVVKPGLTWYVPLAGLAAVAALAAVAVGIGMTADWLVSRKQANGKFPENSQT